MKKTSRAAKAFEDFTGHKASKLRAVKLPDENVAGWEMGPVVGIAYQAKRDGKTQQYFHEFKKAARPRLVSQDDGKQLYIEGGKYKVTDRGIEDMPKLFVVNPSPRAGTAKRKAAPMRRRRTSVKRRTRQVAVFNTNPVRRRRRRPSARRALFARNPIRRRRRHVAMRRNPIRRRRHHVSAKRSYRRNPSRRTGMGGGTFGKMLLPAAGIGLGAIGAEIIMGYLPIPASFKTGVARHITKGVVGVAAGMLIGKVLRQKRLGNFIALGAVVIAVHDGVKEFIAAKMPAVHLGQYRGPIHGSLSSFGGMGYTSPAQVARMGQYVPPVRGTMSSFSGMHPNGGGGETEFAV